MMKSFEQRMERVIQIARILDAGEAPLADSLELYKEAALTLNALKGELDDAEGEITFMRKGTDGHYTEDFKLSEDKAVDDEF